MNAGVYQSSNLNQLSKDVGNATWLNTIRSSKYSWGLFVISSNNIEFERWYQSEPPLKAYVRSGTILNDTTFLITQSYRVQNGQKTHISTILGITDMKF